MRQILELGPEKNPSVIGENVKLRQLAWLLFHLRRARLKVELYVELVPVTLP